MNSLLLHTAFVFRWAALAGRWGEGGDAVLSVVVHVAHAGGHGAHGLSLHAVAVLARVFSLNGVPLLVHHSVLRATGRRGECWQHRLGGGGGRCSGLVNSWSRYDAILCSFQENKANYGF